MKIAYAACFHLILSAFAKHGEWKLRLHVGVCNRECMIHKISICSCLAVPADALVIAFQGQTRNFEICLHNCRICRQINAHQFQKLS